MEQDVFRPPVLHSFFKKKGEREVLRENAGIRLQKVSRFGDCTNGESGYRVMSRLHWKGKH